MIDILALLKRIEWAGYGGDVCPECNFDSKFTVKGATYGGWHDPECQLKAAIDALESGRLVVVDEKTAKLGKWGKSLLPVKQQKEEVKDASI